ncbi:unnamed protein product [Rhizophagus irregularis]|nr:unnamed protein product [Rhizophagus irregularis]CAB5366825.1 unnamed protein product [Rhizophagus irregularis]
MKLLKITQHLGKSKDLLFSLVASWVKKAWDALDINMIRVNRENPGREVEDGDNNKENEESEIEDSNEK